MKNLLESIRTMYQPQSEATMMKDDGQMVHNCAKHVEHAQYGKGATIAEEHADPDRYGNIAWYDVEFPHGVERGVPVQELRILASESHGHETKAKKRKMAEESLEFSMTSEEFDQLDELTKSTLASYASKASKSAAGLATTAMHHKNYAKQWDDIAAQSADKKYAKGKSKEFNQHSFAATEKQIKRQKGVDSALNRLAKEDIDVDETVYHHNAIEIDLDLTEADKNYDGYFKAHMKKHGIKHPGELKSDDEKKKFFNKVDAGFKAKNEEVFLEAWMTSAIQDVMNAHRKAGNKISDEKSTTKDGKPHHSFVVTTPEGKRTRHVYHGTKKSLETMSPAAKSKIAKEVGDDEDDK